MPDNKRPFANRLVIFLFTLAHGVWPVTFAGAAGVRVPAVAVNESEADFNRGYEKLLADFNKRTCPATVRKKFQSLYREFRAGGFYIPLNAQGDVDRATIKRYLKLIEEKQEWLSSLRKSLPMKSEFPTFAKAAQPVQDAIDHLLDLKKQYQLAATPGSKHEVERASRDGLAALKSAFDKMTGALPFLLSFRFPVDHFDNRFRYEQHKINKDKDKENDVFFVRKVLEDGALDKDHTRSDLYLRTTLDTIALAIPKQETFLDENLRFDLEWVLRMIRESLGRGPDKQHERIKAWEKRVERELDFYQGLASGGKQSANEKLAATRAKATEALRDFVYRKHAETYDFFSRQSETMQAAFALDQILLNEAGRATEDNFRDRLDVAHVVINRRFHNLYSKLDKDETIRDYLKRRKAKAAKRTEKHPWLNVLFKEEQFSFTLWYMPAVEYVFCPDFFRVARDTRKSNLDLIFDVLKKPNTRFRALRYFSRFSMVGKLDMSRMWNGYAPLPESPGRKLKTDATLREAIKKDRYRYFYDFTSADGGKYHVLEINGGAYAVKGFPLKPEFFNYRNPHNFKYFEAVKRRESASP